MKKIIAALTLALPLFIGTTANAQNAKSFYNTPYKSRNIGSFSKNTGILSFGFGVPNKSGADYNYWNGNDRQVGYGPLYVKYEHGIMTEIGLGGYMAMAASKFEYGPDRRYTDKILSIGGGFLGYYHFNKLIPVRNLDVYAGAGLGFRQIGYSYDDAYGNSSDDRGSFEVFPLVKVGARYYFGRTFGIYGEGGYDKMSDINLGISLRF